MPDEQVADPRNPSVTSMRRECQRILKERTQFIANDCQMFWRVRLELPKWHKKYGASADRRVGLGGGNFTMLTSLLSLCNLLAKSYTWLKNSKAFVTSDDVELAKAGIAQTKKIICKQSELQELIPSVEDLKRAIASDKSKWKPPRLGECNELESFVAFVLAAKQNGIDLGLENKIAAGSVWRKYRNAMAHMAYPKEIVGVYADQPIGRSMNQARRFIENGRLAFSMDNGRMICAVDRLSLNVGKLCVWLCNEINIVPANEIEGLWSWLQEVPSSS